MGTSAARDTTPARYHAHLAATPHRPIDRRSSKSSDAKKERAARSAITRAMSESELDDNTPGSRSKRGEEMVGKARPGVVSSKASVAGRSLARWRFPGSIPRSSR